MTTNYLIKQTPSLLFYHCMLIKLNINISSCSILSKNKSQYYDLPEQRLINEICFLFSVTVKHFQAKISIWQLLLIFQNSQMVFFLNLFPSTSAALKLNKELPWHSLFFFFFLSSLRFHQEHGEAELWQRAHVQADCDRLRLWKKPRL